MSYGTTVASRLESPRLVRASSPIRGDSGWDHKLDAMLDDLKTTVGDTHYSKSPPTSRREVQIPMYRSSTGGETRVSKREGMVDGGFTKHFHKEYIAPDNLSKTISDHYEYEADPSPNYKKRVTKTTQQSYKVTGGLTRGFSPHRSPGSSFRSTGSSFRDPDRHTCVSETKDKKGKCLDSPITNKYRFSSEEDLSKPGGKGSEIRHIVMRNRFEKSAESHDGVPSSLLDEERRRQHRDRDYYERTTKNYSSTKQHRTASPGNISWEDQVLPHSPQPSPKSSTYSSSYTDNRNRLRHIPAINYVTIPTDRPVSPSSKIIEKHTYHSDDPSALAVDFPVPPKPFPPKAKNITYDYKKSYTKTTYDNNTERSGMKELLDRHSPLEILDPKDSGRGPSYCSGRDISVKINSFSTGEPQSTSTPYPRSRSASPTRPSRHVHISHTAHSQSDSLDRFRKEPHYGGPFPDTSPITCPEDGKIPTRVDDLMTSLSESDDGRHRYLNGPKPAVESEIDTSYVQKAKSQPAEKKHVEIKKADTKNVAGPPVYYPPGHQALFDESMHTMTLKNDGKGMAKWRREAKEKGKYKSSDGDKKVGLVPVCLPLCCGAACTIM